MPTIIKEGKESVLRSLLSAIEEIYQAFPKKQVKGVGLGIAGAIDIDKGIITQSPNFPGWDGYPIKDEIRTGFLKHVPIILENDANAAAMGERWRGAGMGINDLICLTLGTGIGGGIIIKGELVHGADGMAGELGHITVVPNGPRCSCGNHGCLEALASATAIRREAIEALINHPESELNKRCKGNREIITSEMVYHSAESGDPVSQNIYQTMGRFLGVGIASLINVFNPEMVIIGGGVSRAWKIFSPHTKEEVKTRAFKTPAQRAKVVPALCGDDAGLLGAAYLVFNSDP
ncbi:MAG: ROK family protein [Deltaproteobacteria bacterium]|nr:ROK family protein [Deltaproteobacteria bacterium]